MKGLKRILLSAVLLTMTACGQNDEINLTVGVTDDEVVATVNGQPISREMVALFRQGAAPDDDEPMLAADEPVREPVLSPEEALEELINMELMAQAAVRQGLHRDPDTALQLINAYHSALINAVLELEFEAGAELDEAQLRQAYEDYVAEGGSLEYNARHILVDEQAEAQRLIDELDRGADFSGLARRHSTGPRREEGGSMGWLSPDNMLPGFDVALREMTVGEYSTEPVRTPFGWGILLLDQTRERQPPSFEEMRERLVEEAGYQRIDDMLRQLRQEADIEIR